MVGNSLEVKSHSKIKLCFCCCCGRLRVKKLPQDGRLVCSSGSCGLAAHARCFSSPSRAGEEPRRSSHLPHTQSCRRRRAMDSSESYSPSAPRPAGRTVTMKTFLSLIVVFVITQLLGTVLFGLYLHMKLDKMGEEISLREDFVFLKKLQKCRKPQDADASLLDCTKILNIFRELQAQTSPIKEEVPSTVDMLKGDKKPSATIHLAGLRGSRKVLQWKEAVYAPSMDDEFSYQDGKLTINKGGRYYIYSQVAFCAKQEQHLPKQMPPFSVYMYLNLPSESDRLLLKGVGTHGNSDDLCDLQSIYLGRVVELQKGHVIFVNVTDSSRVNYDHGNTYFGMFELS